MFDVDLLVKNQRLWLDSTGGETCLSMKPGDLDGFVREVFGDFPLKDSERLLLWTMTAPITNLLPLPEDFVQRLLYVCMDVPSMPVVSRAMKLRTLYSPETFATNYRKDLVRLIEIDLEKIPKDSLYVFGMWLPVYRIVEHTCGIKRVMTNFGKKILERKS